MKLNIVFVASALAYYGSALVTARPIYQDLLTRDLAQGEEFEARGFNEVDIDARDVYNVDIDAREVEEDLADVYARAPTVCSPQLVARAPTEKGSAAKAVSKIPVPVGTGGKTTSVRSGTGSNTRTSNTRTSISNNSKKPTTSNQRSETRARTEAKPRTEGKPKTDGRQRTEGKPKTDGKPRTDGKPKSGATTRSTPKNGNGTPKPSSNTRTTGNNTPPKPNAAPAPANPWASEFGNIPKGTRRVIEYDF